jgi:hypothetical protein
VKNKNGYVDCYAEGGQTDNGYRTKSMMFDPVEREKAARRAYIEERIQGDINARKLAARSGSIGPHEQSTREKVASWMMGDERASPERRAMVEGLLGTSGLGDSERTHGFGLYDALPLDALGARDDFAEGDVPALALDLIPGMAGKEVRGARSASREFMKAGLMPFAAGGKVAKKAAGALEHLLLPSDLPAPALRTEQRLFDYSNLGEVPDVPQHDLPSPPDPARGIPDYVGRIAEPENMERMDSYVRKGLSEGHGGFYNTMPLRERFVAELGDEEGDAAWRRYIDFVGATSPQNRTPQNARTASYYYMRDRQGDPLRPGMDPPPNPYGHYVQKTHMRGSGDVVDGGLDPLANPKVARFAENLKGNWEPLTVDIHNLRALGYTDKGGKPLDAPKNEHYGFLQRLQQERAREMGIKPAQYQEAAWFGAGDVTNLGSPPDPFLKVFEDKVASTADKVGLPKEEVLRRFIKGELSLYRDGGYVTHEGAC